MFGGLLGSSGSTVGFGVWVRRGLLRGRGAWVGAWVGCMVLMGLLCQMMFLAVGPVTKLCEGRKRRRMDGVCYRILRARPVRLFYEEG